MSSCFNEGMNEGILGMCVWQFLHGALMLLILRRIAETVLRFRADATVRMIKNNCQHRLGAPVYQVNNAPGYLVKNERESARPSQGGR
jgi:hypothetical protein